MPSTVSLGWPLGAVLVGLTGCAVLASRAGGLRIGRSLAVAAGRGFLQLVAVAGVITFVLDRLWASLLFVVVMFAAATATTAGRVGARRDWPWIALAMAAGVVPVLGLIFTVGVTPFAGVAIVPICGIVIGGSMTAHTLCGRRAFDALRVDAGLVEAALALGFRRFDAIGSVIRRDAPEALTPIREQTRTVGLVTLPGAFVGVILGGGSAAEAAAAQLLVLVGLLAAETLVVVAAQALVAAGRIMPLDLRSSLPDM